MRDSSRHGVVGEELVEMTGKASPKAVHIPAEPPVTREEERSCLPGAYCRGTARVNSQKGWHLPSSRPWVPGLSISSEEIGDLSIEVRSLLETRGEAKCRGGKRKMRSSKQWLWELRVPFSVRVGALNVSGIGCRIWGPREMSESWGFLYTTEDTHRLKEVNSGGNHTFQDGK